MKTNNSFVVHNIWSTPIYENFISVDNEWIKKVEFLVNRRVSDY